MILWLILSFSIDSYDSIVKDFRVSVTYGDDNFVKSIAKRHFEFCCIAAGMSCAFSSLAKTLHVTGLLLVQLQRSTIFLVTLAHRDYANFNSKHSLVFDAKLALLKQKQYKVNRFFIKSNKTILFLYSICYSTPYSKLS